MIIIRIVFAVFAVAITLFVSPSHQQTCGDLNADTLQLTLIVFRHGDRTPYRTYPTDPYQEETWMPWGGFGKLTQVGMEQHYEFGKWFRECYSSFLNVNDTYSYNVKDVYVRSTDYDRTLMSAESHLSSAYPPRGFQIWSNDTDLGSLWQPLPIHTVPSNEDYLLRTDITCKPYDALIDDKWKNSAVTNKIRAENQALMNDIATHAGLPTPGDLQQISETMCDSVHIERLKNLKLPDWLGKNATILEKLEDWHDLWIDIELADDDMIRYAAGQLVANIQQLLKNKTTGVATQRHVVYSAHDTTVGTLLAAYGDFNRMGPPYRSAVITELHLDEKTNKYFVKAFYRNDTTVKPYPLNIQDCDNPCWLDKYIEVLASFTIEDKKKECTKAVPSNTLDQGSIIAISVTSSIVVVMVLATVAFLLIPVFRRNTKLDDALTEDREDEE